MQIDKKLLRRLFLLAAGCLVFAWILLDTEQASSAAASRKQINLLVMSGPPNTYALELR